MRDKRAIQEIIRNAFRPLTCEVELVRFDGGIRFRVLDLQGQKVGKAQVIAWSRFNDEALVENDILNYRNVVAATAGVELVPWRWPLQKK
jgi:hypothetical protein